MKTAKTTRVSTNPAASQPRRQRQTKQEFAAQCVHAPLDTTPALIEAVHHEASSEWHLGVTPRELAFARFQHALICLSESFYRNVGRSLAQLVGDSNLNGQDSVLLQVIHSADRPKTITDLQHFSNRTDVANIQYSVRKLERAGLLDRAESAGRSTAYVLTDYGRKIATAYVQARRELLDGFPETDDELLGRLDSAKNLMVILAGLYDHDTREQLTRVSLE